MSFEDADLNEVYNVIYLLARERGVPMSEMLRQIQDPFAGRNGLNKAEPAPTTNKHEAVWEVVIRDIKSAGIDPRIDALLVEDIRERDRAGEKKYGTRLQPLNGRDAIVDAYQEALDLVVYLRQRLLELPLLGAVSDMLLENVYRDSLSIVRRLRTSLLWRD